MEYSLPALSHLAVVSTLRELYRQAVESIPPESYPRVLVSLTHLTHLVPAAQALVVTIPPVLVVHQAQALVSTRQAQVLGSTRQALVPESPPPVPACFLASFPHPEPLSQPGSTPLLDWEKIVGAVSDMKGGNCEECVDGRNAFAMQEIDRNRRLSAHRRGKTLTTNGVLGIFNSFYHTFHTKSPYSWQHEQSQTTSYYSILIVNMYWSSFDLRHTTSFKSHSLLDASDCLETEMRSTNKNRCC